MTDTLKYTPKAVSGRNQKRLLALILISFTLLVLIGCGRLFLKDWINTKNYIHLQIGNEVFILEVADTEAAHTKGLSQRDSLDRNKGMLFDFKTDAVWEIWMIQMRFSIDIIWLNSNGKIVYIKEDVTPAYYPETFHPNQPVRYVIELPAKTVQRLELNVGDHIKLN